MDVKEFERELMADFSAEGEMMGDMIERGSDGPEWAQHRYDAAWKEMTDLAKAHAELAALRAEVERLREAVDAVFTLIAESHGVAGLHLNGDVAPWDELLRGGRCEDWLAPLSDVAEKRL